MGREQLNKGNKRYGWQIAGGLLLVAVLIGFWVYGNVQDYNGKGKGNGADPNAVGTVKVDNDGVVKEEEYVSLNHPMYASKEISTDIFYDEEIIDYDIQRVIHEMSHQKVGAEEKWGALLITEERLKALSRAIDENQSTLVHDDIYREIL